MKSILLLALLLSTPFVFSQEFSISLSINDSVAPGEYLYVIEGSAILQEDMIFHYELFNPSHSNLLSSGSYSSDTLAVNTIQEFVYDDASKYYSFQPGIFESSKNIIHLWITRDSIILSEINYQE